MQELHILVSVLDLDNVTAGLATNRFPTRKRHSNADYLSKRCKRRAERVMRPTGRERTKWCFLITLDHEVYGGA